MNTIRSARRYRLMAVLASLLWLAVGVNAQTFDAGTATKSLTMTLPDGEAIPITLRVMEAIRPSVNLESELAPMYDSLVAEAESGNIVAARFLGQALDICRGAFSSQSELDAAIDVLRTTGNRTYGDGREPQQYNGIATKDLESAMRKQYEFCKGISKSAAFSSLSWTKRAADAGDYYALKRWIGKIGQNNESFELWHDAFERGYVWAAQELAYYYMNGIGGGMGGVADDYNAYVYQTIAFKFEAAMMESAKTEPNTDTLAQYNVVLTRLAGKLRPGEVEQAHKKIASILSSNNNCCVIPGG